jgi:lysophospholipase L1-like esterase
MYSNSGFTKKTLATYTIDGLHPNDTGYARMGDYASSFINAI